MKVLIYLTQILIAITSKTPPKIIKTQRNPIKKEKTRVGTAYKSVSTRTIKDQIFMAVRLTDLVRAAVTPVRNGPRTKMTASQVS